MAKDERSNRNKKAQRPPESPEAIRDRQRRWRSQSSSWLPTAIFLALHAVLLTFGILYLMPWIRDKLEKRAAPTPAPSRPWEPGKSLEAPRPAPVEPMRPVVVPPPPVAPTAPFPPPAAEAEIARLIAIARENLKGELLKVSQDGRGYRSITDAVQAAKDGDVVEIADSGTYKEIVLITDKKDIFLRAANGARPVIDAENKRPYCVALRSSPGVIVRGLTCINASDTAIAVRQQSERAIVAQNVCEDSNFGIRATSDNATIVANVCRANRAVGIALEQGARSVIVDNVATGNNFGGIKIARSAGTIILNNLVHKNGGDGITVSSSDDCSVLRNTVVGAEKYLFRIERSNGATVMNNTGARASKAALSFDPVVRSAVCDHNLFCETSSYGEWQGKPYNSLETWRSATGHDKHSIYEPPAFVNESDDLRLRSDSPARGKADAGDGGSADLGASWERSGLELLGKMLRPNP